MCNVGEVGELKSGNDWEMGREKTKVPHSLEENHGVKPYTKVDLPG